MDGLLVTNGRALATARQRLVAELGAFAGPAYEEMASRAGQVTEKISLDYSSAFIESGAVRDEAELLEEYSSRIIDDLRHRTTTFGIHRDDLVCRLETARAFARRAGMPRKDRRAQSCSR